MLLYRGMFEHSSHCLSDLSPTPIYYNQTSHFSPHRRWTKLDHHSLPKIFNLGTKYQSMPPGIASELLVTSPRHPSRLLFLEQFPFCAMLFFMAQILTALFWE